MKLFYSGNNVAILNCFTFLYDLSNFENSFKDLLLYFQIINTKFKIKDNSNPIFILGTKIDKKRQPKESIIKDFNSFIESVPKINHYEIGTKSNFDFNKFFSELINNI